MKKFFLFFLFLTLSPLVMASVVMSADNPASTSAAEGAPDSETKLAEKRENLPQVRVSLIDFQKKLQPRDQRHFQVLYMNYSIVGVVKTVRKDVGNAIDKCSENNPAMEKDLRKRFDQWEGALNPVLTEADGLVNNMLFVQEYAEPEEVRSIFKLIDDNRTQHENEIKKVPVTTPEACEYLLNKMDETQEKMVGLLKKTLVGLPQSLQELDDEAAVEDKPAAEDKPAVENEPETEDKAL